MKAFIDADVLIWHLRGEQKAYRLLSRLRDVEGYELWMGAMQRAEIVFFMRPDEERMTLMLLSIFHTYEINQKIVDKAGEMYRYWNPRCGTDINDALLAACVLESGGVIYTLNKKHFPMDDVIVHRAW